VLGLWLGLKRLCCVVCVMARVSITGSGSYLNKNFVIFWRLCCHLVSVPEIMPICF